jgi:CRISPR-associated endonuclease/helicase Cas3
MQRKGAMGMERRALLAMAAKSNPENPDEWLPFWLHSRDTAEVMDCLLRHWLPDGEKARLLPQGTEEEVRALCRFLGLIHDIGKLTRRFQSQIAFRIAGAAQRLESLGFSLKREWAESYPHGLAGAAILYDLGCPTGITGIVGSHHGKPLSKMIDLEDELAQNYYFYFADEEEDHWRALWEGWLNIALEECGYSSVLELPNPGMVQQVLLVGLLVMADWIASNQRYFPLINCESRGEEVSPAERARIGWQLLALPDVWTPACMEMEEALFEARFGAHIPNFHINEVQTQVLKVANGMEQPGLLILEAQMGVGKTEAALAAAEIMASKFSCGGLYFGLSTQATANGIFTRLADWAQGQSNWDYARYAIRLAHGMAELNDSYQALFPGYAQVEEDDDSHGLMAHTWFQGPKQALLANFVIGTVDQFLMAALQQKHVMLRHLGLAGKVVIIDECHAYDAYMNYYLDRALEWMGAYRVSVVILSATLPAQRRAELVEAYQKFQRRSGEVDEGGWRDSRAYPRVTWTAGSRVREVNIPLTTPGNQVRVGAVDEAELGGFLREQLADGGCGAVIVNTVKKAQQLAQRLAEQLPEREIILFHAQFLAPDRSKREEELLRRVGRSSTAEERDGLIVVGTQVLEQSLDLDFDIMVTELCPMDLLLQRMGRLHRHDRSRPARLKEAQCRILTTQDKNFDPGSQAIYGAWLLMRTQELLPEEIILPHQIADLVQDTYAKPRDSMDEMHQKAWREYEDRKKELRNQAQAYTVPPPEEPEEGFPTVGYIDGWLDTDIGSPQKADCAVRAGSPSIEVLVMQEKAPGEISFLPWQNGGQRVSSQEVPTEDLARSIARQRLRLPHRFCAPWKIDRTLEDLERMTQRVSLWQQAGLLRGELFLLLDESLRAELGGVSIAYSENVGFFTEERGEEHG